MYTRIHERARKPRQRDIYHSKSSVAEPAERETRKGSSVQTDLANELPRVPLLFQRTDSTGREMLMERDDSRTGCQRGFRYMETRPRNWIY